MTAYYAATFIRQYGELFICTEDYQAADPNYFHHHEMLEYLKRTFTNKDAWKCEQGKCLEFGKYPSKKVAEMIIEGLGTVEELGIEAEMPVYLRLPTLMNKCDLPQKAAEKFIKDSKMQAIVSHRDPSYCEKIQAMGKEYAKQMVMYTNHYNKIRLMRLIKL